MTYSGGKLQQRRTSSLQRPVPDGREVRRPEQSRVHIDVERRSKEQHDRPGPSASKGKATVRQRTPPQKRKVVEIEDPDSSAEESDDGDAD